MQYIWTKLNKMQITTAEINERAKALFPLTNTAETEKRTAYIRGFIDALNTVGAASDEDLYTQVAKGLREIWPTGEKDGKYAWRDSVPNLVKRLQFVWKDRNFADKYSVEDCLRAGRRYVAQFENNAKYMRTLKYFVFRQEKLIDKRGKITYTYKSDLADYLESVENQAEALLFNGMEGELV